VTQSVELLLDPGTDRSVREQWQRLAEAGLPSQAQHKGLSNRPHITVAAAARMAEQNEPALRRAVAALPVSVRLGALACFGRNRFVLVRLVVASSALLQLHQRVISVVGADPTGHFAPGRWSPHVTLGHRLDAEQVGAALQVLDGVHEQDAQAVQCRRWDGEQHREWSLTTR
jgi:2'-5' RNA ligase